MRVCTACGSIHCDDAWVCEECGNKPAVIAGFNAFAPLLAMENAGFREEYFAALAELEAGNFWFRARNELIVWAMRTYVPGCRTFLEVGCGTGFVLKGIHAAFPTIALSGSEIFSVGLDFAANRVPSAAFYQMDARRIPFRDEFDAIGAFDVLEHIDEDEAVIAEAHRALLPRGVFLATVPQHMSLWSQQDVAAYHVRRYAASELRRKITAAGFEIVRMVSFVSLLLPMMFASRLRMRDEKPASEFDALDALRLPRPINAALETVMTVERTLIRRGIAFPAGGSLLVVARKREEAGNAA